jgi:chromosome segregation protein
LRFTRLRLNGFKSFVDPTEMPIHEGLTGIVGPNGCGKSNLLEALRWVMGENRPSAMRGSGMEDVIFNGAASRGARAYAEVALAIDNRERLAPQGFNDRDEIEIVRRITRDLGSVFRMAGKEVRARDVQLLFADASTGAHSPALVRQGQIAELIAAKPKARRRVLEDAAGIGGLYARRHEAELRLQATEANLKRVDDVLDALAQQLVALTRQAKAAARFRELSAELRRAEGMLLWQRFREADAAVQASDGEMRSRLLAVAQAEAAARRVAEARAEAEAVLPPLRDEEAIAAAVAARVAVEGERLAEAEGRARGRMAALAARIAELDRDAAREAQLAEDAGATIAGLRAEEAVLAEAAAGEVEAIAALAAAAAAAGHALAAAEAEAGARTEDAARLAAAHQAAERTLNDAGAARDRAAAAVQRAETAAAEAAQAELRAAEALRAAEIEAGDTARLMAEAEAVLTEAETARAAAAAAEAEARAARSAAEGESAAVRAEAGALSRLLALEASAGPRLLDRVKVAPGYEAALGAALADDLGAPEAAGPGSGWAELAPYERVAGWPDGVVPLAPQVTAPQALARRLAFLGIVSRARGADVQALLAPGQRIVSREGDLWRWDGFRAGAEAPTAAAVRLTQVNRLDALQAELAAVEAKAAAAQARHEAAAAGLADLTRGEAAAREARRGAESRAQAAARTQARAEADRALATGRQAEALAAAARFGEEAAGAEGRLAEAVAARAGLAPLDAARAAVEAARAAMEAARSETLARRSADDGARRAAAARAQRRAEVLRDIGSWQARAATAGDRATEMAERRAEAAAEAEAAKAAPQEIAAKRAALAGEMQAADTRKARAADALAGGEAALRAAQTAEREAEKAAGEAREARARAEAVLDAARAARGAAGTRIREETEMSPEQLLASLKVEAQAIPGTEALEIDIARVRRQREALGAVNLRAEEDLKATGAEHDQLAVEKTDLEEAIKALRNGIAGLNREGRERLLTAFEQVNANFRSLFSTLFGGGEARLTLVESDDPLEAGLEILCQPPGKRLATLSLLSGGEQTLTAMALIFAVFLANPAPVCVLDEVDAPLDDANVGRFCDLLDEMTRRTETRFLIITHHAVTMSRMDRLFGVTMGEPGVSQLVSVDLSRAEALVA